MSRPQRIPRATPDPLQQLRESRRCHACGELPRAVTGLADDWLVTGEVVVTLIYRCEHVTV